MCDIQYRSLSSYFPARILFSNKPTLQLSDSKPNQAFTSVLSLNLYYHYVIVGNTNNQQAIKIFEDLICSIRVKHSLVYVILFFVLQI